MEAAQSKIFRGDFVRWVISYAVYSADEYGTAYPASPVYCYGLVVEVANDGSPTVVVYIPRSCEYYLIDTSRYHFEVLASAGKKREKDLANR